MIVNVYFESQIEKEGEKERKREGERGKERERKRGGRNEKQVLCRIEGELDKRGRRRHDIGKIHL